MKRTGFTLVEIVVVIALIAMLMGILFPVLRASRQQAKAVKCGSNLKQLALALTIYEQENGAFPHGFDQHDMVPPPDGYIGNASYDFQGWWWFHFLNYVLEEKYDKNTILRCPSRKINDPGLKENILCGNYGVNRAICKDDLGFGTITGFDFIGKPLGLNHIRHPAGTLLISDSGYSLISWKGAVNTSGRIYENIKREEAFYVPGLRINSEREFSPDCERDAIVGRHPNKTVNVAFADGHVERIKADDLLVEKIDSDYSNRSPLWVPK